jgi:AcrR family transcriptional regulator
MHDPNGKWERRRFFGSRRSPLLLSLGSLAALALEGLHCSHTHSLTLPRAAEVGLQSMALTKQQKGAPAATGRKKRSATVRRTVAELELRRTPQQARGQATFDGILDATAELLDAVGGEKITTNLIAEVAGVNVATLYQYFPNKQAVLLELFKRQGEARIRVGENRLAGASETGDWRKAIANAVQAVAEARANTPGTVPLRQAMRSSPELLEHEQRYSGHFAAALAAELQVVGVRRERALLVATCAVEALTALLDLWSIETRGRDRQVIEEAKTLLLGYLAPYFEKGRTAATSAPKRR